MSTISKTLVAVLAGILVGGAAYVMAAPADKNTAKTAPAAANGSGGCGSDDPSGHD
jgi:hypothetical protein